MSEFYILSVRFDDQDNEFCYYSSALDKGTKVVAEIDENDYLGIVYSCRLAREGEDFSVYIPIQRQANSIDEKDYEENNKRDLEMLRSVQEEADREGLQMKVFRLASSLDRQKVKILYTADDRVDFRGLVKVLASMLHARIEMHQVGPRDKAKMVGGLGICGLPLCCSTFLSTFEGISIAMAKNQMLAINIPKLSGQCGKLICCLKYEDEAYTIGKKDFPRLGTPLTYMGESMKVASINILSNTVQLLSVEHGFTTISLEEYLAVSQGKTYVKKEEVKPVAAPVAPSSSAFPTYTGQAIKDLPPVTASVNPAPVANNNSNGQGNNNNRPNGNGRNPNYNGNHGNNDNNGNNGNYHYGHNNHGRSHGNRGYGNNNRGNGGNSGGR